MMTARTARRVDAYHEFPPPDWRWRAAFLPPGQLGRAPRGRRPDPWLDLATWYVNMATWWPPAAGLDPDHPVLPVHGAMALYTGPAWARLRLETLLLSELSLGAIARRTGLPGRVIKAYERVFFAVRPRRSDMTALLSRLLRPALPTEREFAYVVGVFGCQPQIDALLRALDPVPDPARQTTAERREIRRHVHFWTALIGGRGEPVVMLDRLVARLLDQEDDLRWYWAARAQYDVREDLLDEAARWPGPFAREVY
jgi:hypothetical protein